MGNKADPNLAINGGAKSSSMLYFVGNASGVHAAPIAATARALVASRYGFTRRAPNTLGCLHLQSTVVDHGMASKVNGQGTLKDLKTALANPKATIALNPGKRL